MFLAGENERDFLSQVQQAWDRFGCWLAGGTVSTVPRSRLPFCRVPMGQTGGREVCADSQAAAWPEALLTLILAGALSAIGHS